MKLSLRAKSWLVPVMSAGLLVLAFSPTDLVFLVFLALAPWLALLRRLSFGRALASGALFGFVYFLAQTVWIFQFVERWTGNAGLSSAPWVVVSASAAVFFAILGGLIQAAWQARQPWLLPLLWAGMEAVRAFIPVIAFPWAILAHPLWRFPDFVQHAAMGTVFLVSAWVLIPNIVLARALWPLRSADRDPRETWKWTFVFLALLMASAYRGTTAPRSDVLVATLGQPGVDLAFSPPEVERKQVDEAARLILARAEAQGSQLLVFPEGFADPSPEVPPPTVLGPRPAVPVVFGGKRQDGDLTFQTAFSYSGSWSWADKTRLVVFGEYVPFRESSLLQGFRIPSGDLTPGTSLKTLSASGITLGPLICFEGLFPDLASRHQEAGAQLLVQMSVDDWYEGTAGWDQLWQSTIWRSIESGMPILRVGGRGQTLATDARGRLVSLVPRGIMEARRVEVKVPDVADGSPMRMAFVWLCWLAMAWTAGKAVLGSRRAP